MKEKIITCFASELSCVWLCDPMDSNTPGSSVHGIFQARILEWFAISYSTGSSWPRNNTQVSWVSCIGRQILYHWETWEACFEMFFLIEVSVQFSLVTQSCPTLCDPMNRSMPGLPVQHQLLEPTQTHVHWVGDAIQPSHPLSSPSPLPSIFPASGSFPMCHLFISGGQSIGVSASTSVPSMNTRTDLL